MVAIAKNTSKDYPCTMCGSPGNIVREDATNPRLKCNNSQCGFMYDAQDSLTAKEAGEIPDGLPDIPKEPETNPFEENIPSYEQVTHRTEPTRLPLVEALPRNPTHVLLSKDRKYWEFVTNRTLKKEVLKWTADGRKFDLYELSLKRVDAKIEID